MSDNLRFWRVRISFWLFVMAFPCVSAQELKLEQGDRICLIGNTLADRMQHNGWMETLFQDRFPELKLSFRNLGFSGDEITVRPRSNNFGTPDSHLTHSGADVVFAFFGYNESFGGDDGLAKFRSDLSTFIEHTLAQKYNGKSAPRLVLFSPIAHEDLKSDDLPDGRENNARLLKYTLAMQEVARIKEVPYVDLFTTMRQIYQEQLGSLTINGVHLSEQGYKWLAEVMDRSLFGERLRGGDQKLDRIRRAVIDKNLHWFNRYRATDGYSVFGGRSGLKFVNGQTNFQVMQRELEILDAMTANRDKVIWARADNRDIDVDDSDIPAAIAVISNRKGKGDDGTHIFLGGKEAIEKMTIAKGLNVNLFASEQEYPELVNPVQMSVDTDGRLWVAAWPTYPHWNPREEMNDKLLILPDDDGDGLADRCITFADKLHNPTGFEFWGGGVLLAQTPDIWFLKDSDGDDKADVRIRVLHGIDSADTHHTANSFVIGPDGALYFQRGIFHYSNVETPWDRAHRSTTSGVYRFDPRTYKFSFHFPVGPNPHGDTFDKWGNQFASDGTSGNGFFVTYPGRGSPAQLYPKRVRPVPAIGIISSAHFPTQFQDNLLVCNVIGFQGIANHTVHYEGAGIVAKEIEPLLFSSDPNFRPSDIEIGGDGALYVLDWQNPLIGHMQHNLRDPSRDHLHGRVYRVTAEGRKVVKPLKMRGKPVTEIVKLLASNENGIRYRARLELSGRDSPSVVKAVQDWVLPFDESKVEDAHHFVEALWVHEQHKVVNAELLGRALVSPEPLARAASVRVLRSWCNSIDGAGAWLLKLASDKHPRVRAEAVIAAARYKGTDAAEVIFAAEEWPKDAYLSHAVSESLKAVDVNAYARARLAAGHKLTKAAQSFMLRNASVADLLKLEKTEAVYETILRRPQVPVAELRQSLQGLAELRRVAEPKLLMDLVAEMESKQQPDVLASLAVLIGERRISDIASFEAEFRRLAKSGSSEESRRLGYTGWVRVAESSRAAFDHASSSKELMTTFLDAVALVSDTKVNSTLYELVRSLIVDPPRHLRSENDGAESQVGIHVDYYQPHPANANIATFDRQTPKNSGIAQAISIDVPQLGQRDQFGLKFTGMIGIAQNGTYTFSTNSDDGSRLYIGDRLVVNNDGPHGMVRKSGKIKLTRGRYRLVVTYFDSGGGDGLSVEWAGPGFKRQRIPISVLTTQAGITLADRAIAMFDHFEGHESQKLQDLARLVNAGKFRQSAVDALSQLPDQVFNANTSAPVVASLIKYLKTVPIPNRTTGVAGKAVALSDRMITKLDGSNRKALSDELDDLRVHTIRLGTLPHRMVYDKERLAVEAGRMVELIFKNTDNMPHNFAIALPGSLEEVGLLGEETARDPDAIARHYVPETDKIIVSGRLLQPGESQTLFFKAPVVTDIYPYVCTYPGHWRRMYGAMYVVENLDEYKADPASYLAEHRFEEKDELLQYNKRNTEWKYADLIDVMNPLPPGRSFEVGKTIFKVASCISCHKVNREGNEFGPDITKLDPKKKTVEHLLRSFVEPSRDIDDKFRSYNFALKSGQVVTGMILKETPTMVEVIVDPLAKAKPTVLMKSEIEEREKAPASIMPLGLLNKLSREEIIDLVGYVLAGGDHKHSMYKHEHHDH